MHNWKRYNVSNACLEHVLFEDTGGIVQVELATFEEILTALGFEKSDGTESYHADQTREPYNV